MLKNLHRSFPVTAGHGTQRFILDNPTELNGVESFERGLVPMDSWQSVEVVHTRDREIEVLLNGGFLCVGQNGRHWPRFPDSAHRTALRGILKKALFRCDAIADLEAEALAVPDVESQG